jgi:hypothetical protein
MIKKYLQNNLLSFFLNIIFVSFFILTIVLAWTEPISSPPGGNVSAPINVGPTGQIKSGGLILNTGGAPIGLIVATGSVGIGTTTPQEKLDVVGGFVRSDTGFCIGTKCITDWLGIQGNYTEERSGGYLILNVQGPICAEEFGLYIYERTGATGTIKFVSMNGRHNNLDLELDNQNGQPWSIHQPCIWTDDPNIASRCVATSTAFSIISWNWNEVKDGGFVTITGSTEGRGYGGGGRIGLPWSIDKYTPSGSYRQTGREFLGNNYGCGRNWWMQVSIPMKNVDADTSKVGWFNPLPTNLNKTYYITLSREKFVYKGGSLYSYMLVHPGGRLNEYTVPIDYASLIDLCADEDGCEMFVVDFYNPDPNDVDLASATYVKCYFDVTNFSRLRCVAGWQGGTTARLLDNDGNPQALWSPWDGTRAILDHVVQANRRAENDTTPGLHFFAKQASQSKTELIIKD